jgi:hypothetical protein
MPEPRSLKRVERYRELRALGFDPIQARRFRDWSGKRIQLTIAREQRRISRKPVQLRTSDESFRLSRIQSRNRRQTQIQQQARLSSRQERWEQFAEFSKTRNWPSEFLRRIRQINVRAGKESADDGYGYRRFYFEYVERLDIQESLDIAERGDSEIRFLTNKPLVAGRPNLRALLRSPKAGAA